MNNPRPGPYTQLFHKLKDMTEEEFATEIAVCYELARNYEYSERHFLKTNGISSPYPKPADYGPRSIQLKGHVYRK